MHLSRFGNPVWKVGTPSPTRSIGIIELEENSEIIYVAQSVTGKIFRNKELAVHSEPLCGFMIGFSSLDVKERGHIRV